MYFCPSTQLFTSFFHPELSIDDWNDVCKLVNMPQTTPTQPMAHSVIYNPLVCHDISIDNNAKSTYILDLHLYRLRLFISRVSQRHLPGQHQTQQHLHDL